MPRKKRQEDHENLERWLISYADFITLLFAFFVVMYAISSVNQGKYRVLSDTLSSAFHATARTLQPIQTGSQGVDGPPAPIKSKKSDGGKTPSIISQLRQTAASGLMGKIAGQFEQSMQPLINKDLINVKRNDLWVQITINTSLLFTSGSAALQPDATPILNKVAAILRRYPNPIQVEGFTDNVPINTVEYPSNWELSAARAASVVHLFMQDGVGPERMAAVGFGQYRPIASNATAEGRRKNRRVVVVVLANEQARRALDVAQSSSAGRAAGAQTAGGQAAGGQTAGGQAAGGQTAGGQAAGGQAAGGQTAGGGQAAGSPAADGPATGQ